MLVGIIGVKVQSRSFNEYKKTRKFISRLFRRGKKKIATPTDDRWINQSVLGSALNQQKLSVQISRELDDAGERVSPRTVR